MKFELTAEQQQIQESVRDFLDSNGGIQIARDIVDGKHDVIEELWKESARKDYTALTVPVEHGGLGDGMLMLCTLLEAAGRVAMPGPYPETLAFTAPLITELGTEEQKSEYLPAIAAGNLLTSFALYEPDNRTLPEAIQMDAERTDAGFRLSGTKSLVSYAAAADCFVVAARTRNGSGDDGISLFLVDGSAPEIFPRQSLDRTRPLYDLSFDRVVVDEGSLLGELGGSEEPVRRALDRLNIVHVAMLVGGATEAVERSVEYGNQREQYGHPIGMYQAVKHRIVEMWIDAEQAWALTYYAAWALDNDEPDAASAVSAAKAFCSERCRRIFSDDIWNHGAMGFSWDHDAHLHFKRAKSLENLYGDVQFHLNRIVEDKVV